MYSNAGVSDIIGVTQGRALFVEVKTPEKRDNTTKLQEIFIDKVKEAGAIAFIACSVEEVKNKLESELN